MTSEQLARLLAAIDRNTAAIVLSARVALAAGNTHVDEWRHLNTEANEIESLLWLKAPKT